jgi:uncharacterized membrane protein YgcG
MRSVFAYTAARIVLFVVALGLVYLAGARGLLALAIAIVISGLASFVLLSRQRDAMSGSLVSRLRAQREQHEQGEQGEGGSSGSGGLFSRVREIGHRLDEGTRAEDRD